MHVILIDLHGYVLTWLYIGSHVQEARLLIAYHPCLVGTSLIQGLSEYHSHFFQGNGFCPSDA